MFLINQEKINTIFSQKVRVFLKVIVALVFLGLTSFLLYKMFFSPKPFDTLSGTIYMTLAQRGDKATDLYRFDIKTRNFSKIFEDNFIKYTGKISLDNKKIAFSSALLDRSSEFPLPSRDFLQVKLYDQNTKNIDTLTDTNSLNKRIGGWSPDGKRIVFSAQSFETVNSNPDHKERNKDVFLDPSKWSIDIIDLDKNIQHIEAGSNPVWSPDGTRIFFLKNDGLYVYIFSDKQSKKIYDVNITNTILANTQIGISHNGKYLVLNINDNIPARNRLLLFEIISHEFVLLKFVKNIGMQNKETFWPVFSPDDRYVVFQEAELMSLDKPLINPHLVVYDTITDQHLELTSLDQYNFDFAFVDDWR